jgi:hypothetical protein
MSASPSRLLCMFLLCAATAAAARADFVIPAAGTGHGARDSQWQSEVTLHNAGREPLTAQLSFHDSSGPLVSHTTTVGPRQTLSLHDVVANTFGLSDRTGAITIDTDEVGAQKLAVTSRTFNSTPEGEFGQDIPALRTAEALRAGDTGVIAGPSRAFEHRFNFGIFAVEESRVEWRLVRRDGTVAASLEQSYGPGVHHQYNSGVITLLAAGPQDSDVIHAHVLGGRLFVYGSFVDEDTGDPTFVPGNKTRENLPIQFLGIDWDQNGTVDVRDADGDGVLDLRLIVPGGRFPISFRLVAVDPEGRPITFSLVRAPGEAALLDTQGTIGMYPPGFLAGRTDIVVVRASDGVESVDFQIPVEFQ